MTQQLGPGDVIDFRGKLTLSTEQEQPMETESMNYRQRREAGYYLPENAAVEEAPVEEEAAAEPEPDSNGATLKELQAEAEARGLPTYGTKAQLQDRIDDYDTGGDNPL